MADSKVPLFDLAMGVSEIPNMINCHTGQIKFRTEASWGKCCAGTHCVVAIQKAKDTGFSPKAVEGPIFSDLEGYFWCGPCMAAAVTEQFQRAG